MALANEAEKYQISMVCVRVSMTQWSYLTTSFKLCGEYFFKQHGRLERSNKDRPLQSSGFRGEH